MVMVVWWVSLSILAVNFACRCFACGGDSSSGGRWTHRCGGGAGDRRFFLATGASATLKQMRQLGNFGSDVLRLHLQRFVAVRVYVAQRPSQRLCEEERIKTS